MPASALQGTVNHARNPPPTPPHPPHLFGRSIQRLLGQPSQMNNWCHSSKNRLTVKVRWHMGWILKLVTRIRGLRSETLPGGVHFRFTSRHFIFMWNRLYIYCFWQNSKALWKNIFEKILFFRGDRFMLNVKIVSSQNHLKSNKIRNSNFQHKSITTKNYIFSKTFFQSALEFCQKQ